MSERRRLLMRSSENLSQLIQLALLHEENIHNEYTDRRAVRSNPITPTVQNRTSSNYEVHTYEFNLVDLLERYIDSSYNRRTTYDNSGTVFDVSSIAHLLTYTQYNNIINPLNTSCAITHDEFIENDEVIMINECRHIFKTNPLINWLRFRQTCPCCRIILH
jgi:hypothetical protein